MSDVAGSSKELSFLEWLKTPEGEASIAESERVIHETEEILAKGRDIPWEKLHEPFTI